MRVLITGAAGFAGGYLAQACSVAGDDVLGVSRSGAVPDGAGRGQIVDLHDIGAIRAALRDYRPEVIYHLAALSSVGHSWERPADTVLGNVTSDVNLLEAIRAEAPGARVVWVSSCQVYGAPDRLPVAEDAPMRPDNPYGVSKATGDLLAGVYADAHELNLVRARPFNHAGPGQRPSFLLSSLAHQGAQARVAGARTLRILTGNPDTRRDFTDVRDVVRAYRALAAGGGAGPYNVSSGVSISAADQVRVLAELIAPIEVERVVDPARLRRVEVMDLRGSGERIAAAVGWRPEIPLRQTMRDTLDFWERRLRSAAPADGVRH